MTPGRVWLAWLTANVVPSLVVAAVILVIQHTLGVDQVVVIAFVLLFGLVAWWQSRVWVRWRALRDGNLTPRWWRWAAWTLGGLLVAMFFGVGTLATLDGLGSETLGLVLGWVIAGVVLGFAQSFALGVSRAHVALWVAASVCGWGAAAALFSQVHGSGVQLARIPLLGSLMLEGNVELAITAFTFALYGISTGAVLSRLTPKA